MIAVTGATGHLGRLVVEGLLERGAAPAELAAIVRSPEKAGDLAERGVAVRRADYEDPAALRGALAGVETLLLVSSNEVGKRARQHANVLDAAIEAGVSRIAYTSILKADTSRLLLAGEHLETEERIRASEVPFVFLRNSWYLENYTPQIPQYLEHGTIPGSADDGRVSAATRADYAAAAVEVLLDPSHQNVIYELGGEAFTMPELADELTRQSGRTVVYRDLPVEEYVKLLESAGVPGPFARLLADGDTGVARGELYTDRDDLRRLIGRDPTPMARAVAEALAEHAEGATR